MNFFAIISKPRSISFNLEKIDVIHETCKDTVRCQMMSKASILPYLHITAFQTTNQVLKLKSKSLMRNLPWFLVIIAKDVEDILAKKYIFYFWRRNEQAEIKFHDQLKIFGPHKLSSGRCSATLNFKLKRSAFTHNCSNATFS